jgi:glycosyltransferase involved in cell wall biosynthesis
MNICFVSTTIDPMNGSGRFAYSMITRLRDDYGVEPIILIRRGEPITIPGAKAVLFQKNILGWLLNPLIIAWQARKAKLIHAFDGWPCLPYAYLATRLVRRPYTTTIYGTYGVLPMHIKSQAWLLKRAYDASAGNVGISHITADRVREVVPGVKIQTIKQGINFAEYQKNHSYSKPLPPTFVLTVATLKRRKGFHVAIPAMARVLTQIPDLTYVIVARQNPQDEYTQDIYKLIEQHGIKGRIVWLADLSEEELIGLYKKAAVFFCPSISLEDRSYFEGFGSTYLEAQACGVPVITSLGGGQEDALDNNKSGYLIPEGDDQTASEKLLAILTNPNQRQEMSKAALAYAESLDWKNVLKDYLTLFTQIEKK